MIERHRKAALDGRAGEPDGSCAIATPGYFASANSESSEFKSLLDRALRCLEQVPSSVSPIVDRLRHLRRRLHEERFQLAVLGQFKRGKSTFLNALLGEPFLPTGVIPLTAIATFIAWRQTPLVRVAYRAKRPAEEFEPAGPDDIRNCLFRFVAEEGNPKNHLGVARVELFFPAPILKGGVVLIDTPGIGSTHRHNTDAALEVLPECDAALFVVSADPPITQAELDYLQLVRPKVARLLFVLNKADYLEDGDLQVAVEFLRKTLSQAKAETEIFCVSALRGLKAKQAGDAIGLDTSGIANVESYLLRYLARDKLTSLQSAVARKASDLLAEGEANLSLQVRALEMPLEDLERRSITLSDALSRIAGEMLIIRDLLAGDRRRAVEQLEHHAEQLRQKGHQYLSGVLEHVLTNTKLESAQSAAQQAIASAIPEFFEQELSKTSREFRRSVEEILAGHQQRIEALINLVRRTAADLFDVPHVEAAGSEPFKLGREPYWVTQEWSDRIFVVPTSLLNRFMPATIHQTRVRAELQHQIDELVSRNVENLRWSTLQGLDDTFRRFATMLEERLNNAIEATQGAVKAASTKRSTAADRADAELESLRAISDTIAEVRAEIMAFAAAAVTAMASDC